MGRIRCIKPETPHSENLGRVSRDARLLFIFLWTIYDDEGRARGNSRMLASLLFPYDDDAPRLINGWLRELESDSSIIRYQAGGDWYICCPKWLIHQKIDHPSKSRLPAPPDVLANPREASRILAPDMDMDRKGEEGKKETKTSVPSVLSKKAKPRSQIGDFKPDQEAREKALAFWSSKGRSDIDLADQFALFQLHHLKVGSTMANWPAAWGTWFREAPNRVRQNHGPRKSSHAKAIEGAAIWLAELEETEHRSNPAETQLALPAK